MAMVSEEQQQILDIKVKYEDAIYGIIRYKEKIEDLKAAIKDLKKQEEDKVITTNELKVQTEAISATIKEYQYNTRALQKEIQNNVRQEQQQEGSLKQLRAELSNATKAFDELSRAERDGAKGKELQKHINDITNELKEAEEATQRFYRNVGNYEGAINNAIFGNSKFGASLQSIMDMAGEGRGLSGILDGLTTKTKAFGSAVISLVTNPYFAALAGVAGAGMAFKWFYDYNKSILEATRLTKEFTGYTGESLETMRNNIQATADTFGKDFKDVLSTADVLMSNFHVSGEQAMKIINDGFASGADLSGDMLQKMQQYAPTFKDAGIEADQMVAILQQTRSGIFSDKGLDVITTASKKIREMNSGTASALDAIGISSKQVQSELQKGTITTFNVIQKVATKMKSFGADSKEVGTVLKDVFGKQGAAAGIQLIEQLDTMSTDLDEVKEQTGAWGKTQEENVAIHRQLNSYMSSMFDMSQKGFGEIIAQGKIFGTKVLLKMLKGIYDCYNGFVDWYNESEIFRGLVQKIGLTFKALWSVVKLVANLVIDAFKQMGRSAKGVIELLEGVATFDLAKAKKGLSDILNFSMWKEGWKDAKKAGAEIGKAYGDSVVNTAKSRLKRLKLANVDGGKTSEDTTTTTTTTDKDNGDNSTSKSGKSGKSGKTASKVDAAKLEAEKLKQIERQLQADIAKIQFEYNEKVMDAKRKYLAGMYKNDTEYKDDLQNLEKEMIEQSLNTYVQAGAIGEDKAQEMKDKLLDIMIKAKEELKQKTKEIIDAIDKEFEEAEKKRREADIMSGGTGDEGDEAAKLQRYKDFLNQRIELYKDYAGVQEELFQKLHDTQIKLQKDANEKNKVQLTNAQENTLLLINTISEGLQSFFDSEEITFHNFLKTMLLQFLNSIEAKMSAAYVEILAGDLGKLGFAGIASATAKLALIKTAFAAAKSMVKGFSVGGYVQGSGSGTSDSIPARLSNGESVMTAKATSMFSPILSAFNQLGGGVPIVVNNGGQSQIGMDMLAAAVAKGYMMAPRPVVSVEEVSEKQKRVQTIENIGRL